MSEPCKHYRILSDDQAHEHCLPPAESMNLYTVVECTAPRLINGRTKECGIKFVVHETYWKRRKYWQEYIYCW